MSSIQYLSQPEVVSMADEWFDIADENHFWMQWRFQELLKKIKNLPLSPILEIGCGNGIVMKQFEKSHYTIDGCDLNEIALRKISGVKGKIFVYNIYDQHEKINEKYNSIILLDVIEHIEEDIEFLKKASSALLDDGYVLINVPAHQFLYSKYDTAAGHVRRYNKIELSQVLEAANLQLIQSQYWGWTMIPIAILRKLWLSFVPMQSVIKKGFRPSPIADKVLRLFMKIELKLNISPFIGTSLIAVCKYKKS